MRINGLNENKSKSSVAFGYDQRLNATVIKQLSKKTTALSERLLKMNDFCNKTEDVLEIKTKGVKLKEGEFYEEETESLIGMFLGAKESFAAAIEKAFPKLNYAKRESRHYTKIAKKDAMSWKNEASMILEDVSIENDEILKSFPEFEEGAAKSAGDLVPELTPGPESPTGLSSLGAMEKIKENFMDKIITPIKDPEMAKLNELEYGEKIPRATLLVGPPGCGKTFVAEAGAREAQVPIFVLKPGKAGSMNVNGTSMNYESAFEFVGKKSKDLGKPVFLLMDEMEGVGSSRTEKAGNEHIKDVGTLNNLINKARENGVIVIGAVNRYKTLDEALASRFDNKIYVGLPDKRTRTEVLKKIFDGKSKAAELINSETDLAEVAEKFDKFSNRSITDLSSAAALIARKDGRRNILKEDFFKVIAENQDSRILNEAEYFMTEKGSIKPVGYNTKNNC